MASPRYLNSLPADIERVCKDCGRRASWLTFRAYKNGVRYAKWYHCTLHIPHPVTPNFIAVAESSSTPPSHHPKDA